MKDALYVRCLTRLRELLALEYNCSPEDFRRRDNVLTRSALHPGQRDYGDRPYYFHMVSCGMRRIWPVCPPPRRTSRSTLPVVRRSD